MKKGWIIALLLLLIGGLGAYVWYSRLKNNAAAEGGAYDNTLKPRLEMSNATITNIDADKIDMTVRMLIDNPLPVGFKAKGLNYTVLMANTPIVQDKYEKTIEVKSGDSTYVTLPMRVLLKQMTQVLKTLDKKDIDSTTYTIQTTFDLDVPILGERTFKTTINKRLPTYYVPEIKIDDIDFGKVGLKRTDVAAKVRVVNRNKFPYNFTDTHYSVFIDGKLISEGDQPEPILIRAQATTPVVFPVSMKPGQALSIIPDALFNKETTPYMINFRCRIVDKDKSAAFNNSKMNMQIKGTLADFKKLASAAAEKKDAQQDAEKADRKEERQEKREERKEERQERREERKEAKDNA
ncbi:LEA type 2 family protein [Spirosoma utsteinense]|uniref:LEA14-like dessication related protein n=1 Tax=Spirosoma utsteinense TaxID=2585773 RepID=A0ABR6W1M3_9BACT|nr:LEA type 2 family protein [Spirosoma utsteinense]MBC3788123.1 LEA14-like dessication related protein [Spirosoma utsteinense]MBC3790016.1 LEA14-like dessication related protein [Spirosoma utsteinense]